MIEVCSENKNPNVEGGSIVTLTLAPDPEESPVEFHQRLDRLVNGVHQMEFKKWRGDSWLLKIELNPQWQAGEEHDDLANVAQDELLREFHATTAGTVNNKIDYGKE